MQIDREASAGGKLDCAKPCRNHAIIDQLRRHQRSNATLTHQQRAIINDLRTIRCTRKAQRPIASHKIIIIEIMSGGHKGRRVHHRISTKHDAIRIDQQQLTVRRYLTQDL